MSIWQGLKTESCTMRRCAPAPSKRVAHLDAAPPALPHSGEHVTCPCPPGVAGVQPASSTTGKRTRQTVVDISGVCQWDTASRSHSRPNMPIPKIYRRESTSAERCELQNHTYRSQPQCVRGMRESPRATWSARAAILCSVQHEGRYSKMQRPVHEPTMFGPEEGEA